MAEGQGPGGEEVEEEATCVKGAGGRGTACVVISF